MRIVYIVLISIGSIVLLFFIVNRIYRYNTIDANLEQKIAKGAIILDVRTESEFSRGHIEGSINISLGSIDERYVELDSSQSYITYCSHGIRSMEVKKRLKNKGFKKVYNGGAQSDLEEIIKKVKVNK